MVKKVGGWLGIGLWGKPKVNLNNNSAEYRVPSAESNAKKRLNAKAQGGSGDMLSSAGEVCLIPSE